MSSLSQHILLESPVVLPRIDISPDVLTEPILDWTRHCLFPDFVTA